MWLRKVANWGEEKAVRLPNALTKAMNINAKDKLLVTVTGRNIITLTRVEADRVPEEVLRLASELPEIAYGR